MSLSFSSLYKVKKKREYRKIFKARNRIIGKHINVDYTLNNFNYMRLGLTVSSKFAKANKRNKFKRQIREVFRVIKSKENLSIDINISPRSDAVNSTFLDLNNELDSMILQIKKSLKK
ncbi:MAG: Ribonuclease P protein component [Candidatus Anoxychlamydiales bacterium]|nr:Ribonuclease P protein component [Candidatus Anoxychlamydiales bacterium]